MKYEVVIEFTTNFLGSGPRRQGIRSVERTKDGRIKLPLPQIYEAIRRAPNGGPDISLSKGFEQAVIVVLKRVYGGTRVDRFEGIARETQAVFYCMAENREVGELVDILNEVGRTVGVSQWGKKFNCGRFKVASITKK